VQRDQLGAIGEGRLDLHLVDHLGDSSITSSRVRTRHRIHQIDYGPPVAAASYTHDVKIATVSG
jgi:hypothetical protein